jgi:hypothetical protein
MTELNLAGIEGQHLWGFLTAIGTLSLLDEHARLEGLESPRLAFREKDGTVVLQSPVAEEKIAEVLFEKLKDLQRLLDDPFADIKKPKDFTRSTYQAVSVAGGEPAALDLLAGLACVVGEEASESTLCAANGASHQDLVQSMRDVLKLVEAEHIKKALFSAWTYSFHLSKKGEDKVIRDRLELGDRNPPLRLDPSDERLYALRFSNPKATDDFSTELGAQALAIPAFTLLPVVPGKAPVTVASKRSRQRVTFSWVLWNVPAELRTVRSLAWVGAGRASEQRERGVFAAFSADRISGAKGKLSFAPSQGVW